MYDDKTHLSNLIDMTMFLGEISEQKTTDDVWAKLAIMLEPLEFECLFYCSGVPNRPSKTALLDKFEYGLVRGDFVSQEFANEYLNLPQEYLEDEYISKYCKTNISPIIFECNPFEEHLPDGMKHIYSLASDFGLYGGIVVPLHNADNTKYGNMSFMSKKDMSHIAIKPEDHLAEFVSISHYANAVITELETKKSIEFIELSPRERECLLWVAKGFRTDQISDRLYLTNDTINEYISNARKKLTAKTRSEAVARALSLGLINL